MSYFLYYKIREKGPVGWLIAASALVILIVFLFLVVFPAVSSLIEPSTVVYR